MDDRRSCDIIGLGAWWTTLSTTLSIDRAHQSFHNDLLRILPSTLELGVGGAGLSVSCLLVNKYPLISKKGGLGG